MKPSGIDGYRDFLARRDGEADLLNRRLTNRERFFHELEANPLRSAHPADRSAFLRNLRRRRPEPGLDKKMLFLLATAKLNQAERFGVGLGKPTGATVMRVCRPRTSTSNLKSTTTPGCWRTCLTCST
ncbi:hypothetical protein I552_10106 [Mycobacterium xenopi 3993]|nr:hypothetical protein I552_10106 [Mycobacterium xenopi 3993]